MAGVWLQSPVAPDLELAVRAGTSEVWTIKDEGSCLYILVVPLPGAKQAIVHSHTLQNSPFLINTQHATYAKNVEELSDVILQTHSSFVDGSHLAFLWLWLFENDVLELERRQTIWSSTTEVNVEPWRLALTIGIDDVARHRLLLKHKLPFLVRKLGYTTDTLVSDRTDAKKHGYTDNHHLESIKILEEKSVALSLKIQKVCDELEEEET